MAAGDDLAAGLEDDLVGLDGIEEVFDLGGDAASGLALLLGDGEVVEDVAAGVADQAGEVENRVVTGREKTLIALVDGRGCGSLSLTNEIYLR